jgi:predicted dehydrogenase
VDQLLAETPHGRLVAKSNENLTELLENEGVELVSLCSPRRIDQAGDAIACLRAGKHVYAEKPAAFTNEELDAVLAVAEETGREFHEMADTVFHQPWWALRRLVRAGDLGEIVQVWAQKSYPAALDVRPRDEAVDGGLIRQCGIHAARMVEHLTGLRVTRAEAFETTLGNVHAGSDLRMAASVMLTLENGGVASIVANYLNPRGFPTRGNDQVRIFGTLGIAELVDNATRTWVVIGDRDLGPVPGADEPVEPFFHTYLRHLRGLCEMPMSLEEELHPLRVVNEAKARASG